MSLFFVGKLRPEDVSGNFWRWRQESASRFFSC
jgi:hypothetical protein